MSNVPKTSAIEQYVNDFVKKLRDDHEVTQEYIANIIGVKQAYIANIENPEHKAKYNLKHIDLLAAHFGITPQAFLPKESLIKLEDLKKKEEQTDRK